MKVSKLACFSIVWFITCPFDGSRLKTLAPANDQLQPLRQGDYILLFVWGGRGVSAHRQKDQLAAA